MNSSTLPSNTALEPFPFLPSWRSASPPQARSAMWWLPSWRLRSSRSLRESQPRDLWGWLRWGVFAVLAMYLGLSSWLGDQLALYGKPALAGELCPWNRYVRTRVGYDGTVRGDVNAVLQALKTDPWSADLTFGAGLLYYVKNDQENSIKYFTRFIQIAPNSPIIQRVEK